MFNISLAWAFLISFLASPGGKLLSLAVEIDGLKHLPPYHLLIVNIVVNSWLPAILIYLALRALRAQRYLSPDIGVHILMGAGNVLLTLYVGLRVFTSTVEGGGATIALASVGRLYVPLCLLALVVGTIWLAVRSIWRASKKDEPPQFDERPVFKTVSGILAVTMLLPPAGFLVWTYASNFTQIKAATVVSKTVDSQFEKLCNSARMHVRKTAENVSGVFFLTPSGFVHDLLNDLDFVEVKVSPVKSEIKRYTKKDGKPAKLNGKLQEVNVEYVSKPEAKYQIASVSINRETHGKHNIRLVETTIYDLESDEILATFSLARRSEGFRLMESCPRIPDWNYSRDIIWYALGLLNASDAEKVEKRIDAFNATLEK